MTTIVSLKKSQSGVHSIEGHSWITASAQVPEGFILVPEYLVEKTTQSFGYCDLVIEGGVLADIIPLDRPPIDLPPDPLTDLQMALVEQFEENLALREEITNAQLALAEMYEMMLGGVVHG